ncbi:LysR family transcriptional regulator [Effusibacillus consociatus]|uniref:LysR family transcriptional regulator n=1 Tax=Effusibacillus consociatus TaxID=1117041 RepID=A0ABV9Q2T5_9BACL
MDMQALLVFERVARERSISVAAASLGLSQPTVSARIQSLETELEQSLFDRTSRGVELTKAGEVFLPYVQRALEVLQEGKEAVRLEGNPVRRLTVGATAAIGAYLLPPVIHSFTLEHDVDIVMYTGHSHQVLQMLLDDVVQVGFVISAPVRAGIKQIQVYQGPILAFASPAHPLTRSESCRLADLKNMQLAMVNWGPGYEDFLSTLTQEIGHPPRGLVKVSPVEAAKTLAASGGVITFLPELVAKPELERGELVPVPIADMPQIDWSLYLLYRDRKLLDQTVEEFISFVPKV